MANELTRIMDFKELERWGEFAQKSGVIPLEKVGENLVALNKEKVMAIIQSGNEMGLQPFQSLRCMAFVRGRLTMKVELQLALAKNRGVTIEKLTETNGTCTVTLKRGAEERTCTWTRTMAEKAGLIRSADSNWSKYEIQMLRWRSIGDCLRLIAPDFTMGLISPEEAETIPPEMNIELSGKPDVEIPTPFDTPPPSNIKSTDQKITANQIETIKTLCKRRAVTSDEILKTCAFEGNPVLENLTHEQMNLMLVELEKYQVIEDKPKSKK